MGRSSRLNPLKDIIEIAKDKVMEDIYSFIKSKGKHIHGIKLLKYVYYVVYSYLIKLFPFILFIPVYKFLDKSINLHMSIDSLRNIRSINDINEITVYTALVIVICTLGIIHFIQMTLFILLFWCMSYYCTYKVIQIKESNGSITIKKVKFDDEEYNTSIRISKKEYNKKIHRNNMDIATNSLTKQCFII